MNFSKLKNLVVNKPVETKTNVPEESEDLSAIFVKKEDPIVRQEPPVESISSQEVTSETEPTNLVPHKEIEESAVFTEEKKMSESTEDKAEPIIDEQVSTALVPEDAYKKYISSKLGFNSEDVILYQPESLLCEAIDFSEIKDSKGLIKNKVIEFELKSKLSCMPFNLIGLNPNVVQIQDYDIFSVNNIKYVSSATRIVNPNTLKEYESKWSSKVECGDKIEEDLMIDVEYEGNTVRTIRFNKYELDFLLSRFSKVEARLVFHKEKLLFVAGI